MKTTNNKELEHIKYIINKGLSIDGEIVKPLDIIDLKSKESLIKTLSFICKYLEDLNLK